MYVFVHLVMRRLVCLMVCCSDVCDFVYVCASVRVCVCADEVVVCMCVCVCVCW